MVPWSYSFACSLSARWLKRAGPADPETWHPWDVGMEPGVYRGNEKPASIPLATRQPLLWTLRWL